MSKVASIKKEKIVKDVAVQEFERFLECMGIDGDTKEFDSDDLNNFNIHKNRIVKSIQLGHLIINDNGEAEYTTQRVVAGKDPIKVLFYEPDGSVLLSTDKKKQSQTVGKMYQAMAHITKLPPGIFSQMKMADIKICVSITTLFLDV